MAVKKITKEISPAFDDFLFNWDYEQYLAIGGYGSGKSYHVAFKIILKLLSEKRKAIVIREVFDTIKDSCYDLFREILDDMGILTDDVYYFKKRKDKVLVQKSPMQILFPNGSQIIFKGMDKPEKVKSLNGVSIVWMEECSEIKYDGYKEMLGRIRTRGVSMHFILSCNPVNKENWVYRHFFRSLDNEGNETIIVDEERFYDKKIIVNAGTYYHHSVPTDNPFLPWQYLQRLEKIKQYDYPLYLVARWGRFGATGTRVLPQILVWKSGAELFKKRVRELGISNQYFGFDFGFEESFNAVVSCSVDQKNGDLYIWGEIYLNHVTDDKFANLPEMQKLRDRINSYNEQGYNKIIVADNEDPKAIQFYRQCGYKIRPCINKFAGSRLSNTRKMKRFAHIYISPKCKNTIRELKNLTYNKAKNGDTIYDEFNIDPHTFNNTILQGTRRV